MQESLFDNRKWNELGISDKVKLSIAGILVISSIVLGFVSFILLMEIPTSVIGLDGLWLSTALAVLGITSYFHNELSHFQAEVKTRLKNLEEQ